MYKKFIYIYIYIKELKDIEILLKQKYNNEINCKDIQICILTILDYIIKINLFSYCMYHLQNFTNNALTIVQVERKFSILEFIKTNFKLIIS